MKKLVIDFEDNKTGKRELLRTEVKDDIEEDLTIASLEQEGIIHNVFYGGV